MKISESFIKEVLKQYTLEEISFGKMVELINQEANKQSLEKCNHDNAIFDHVEQKMFCDKCGYLVLKSGVEIIAEERLRQIQVEGWSPEHDKEHTNESIACAAACYAMPDEYRMLHEGIVYPWLWSKNWWKPSPEDRVKELAKSGSLCGAEIDRINLCKSIKEIDKKYLKPAI